jgi:hypothetical protein
MAATFSPSFVIDITDTISNGQTATITLPRGSWNLSSITTTGGAAATITVGTALVGGAAGGATVTLPATDPSVVFTGTITVACGGGAQLNDTVLRLTASIGQTLTVAVA